MKRILLTFLLSCAATSAMAQTPAYNWNGVISGLALRGINPTTVPWASVNQACMGLLNNTAAFSTCQLEYASHASLWQKDADECETIADDNVRVYSTNYFYPVNGRYYPQRHYSHVRRSNEAERISCLRDRGWNSADNYMMGRSF